MNPDKLTVKDNPSLYRDTHSKAIINTDSSNYQQARSRKKKIAEKNKEISDLKNEVADLRSKFELLLEKMNELLPNK